MRILINYLRDFIRQQLNWKFFLPLAAFLVLCFLLNYHLDLKITYFSYSGNDPTKYLRIFLFYLFPLVVSLLLYTTLGPDRIKSSRSASTDSRVWVFLIFAALSYTLAEALTPFDSLIQQNIPGDGRYYALTIADFFTRSVLMMILPAAWWYYRDRARVDSFYGFHMSPGHSGTYMVLAVIAVALAYTASLLPDFSNFYPMSRPADSAAQALGVTPLILVVLWECVYLFQFVALEFFFRGFLLMGLGRLMGAGSVWVMSSMYLFIHFNKPPLEAFASFFAGILLGVLALRTGSILGGVVLHGTIALAMDLFALLRTA